MEKRTGNGKVIGGIVLALVIMVVSQMLAQLAALLLTWMRIPAAVCNLAAGILYIGCTYALIKALITRFLKGNLEDYNIPHFRIEWKWLLTAFLLPLGVTGVYLCLPGELVRSDMTVWEVLNTLTVGIFFLGLGAGIVEELVFRGVILHLLDKRFGKTTAIIAPSVLFGALHIIGGDMSFFSAILVVIAGTAVGIMFSLIALEKKSVWNSAAVHAVWNIIMIGGILGIGEAADSGNICSYVLSTRHFALTGGEFGVEASVIAVLGYLVVCCVAGAGIYRRK